jgi:hypothetical protein
MQPAKAQPPVWMVAPPVNQPRTVPPLRGLLSKIRAKGIQHG